MEYAAHICKENWLTLCDSLQGTLCSRKTWHLLRYLIEPLKNKGETSKSPARTLHLYQGTTDDLIQDLRSKYLHSGKGDPPLPYDGPPYLKLDRDIAIYEVRAAIAASKRSSPPGQDQITNKTLANLNDKALEDLTENFNMFWRTGKLPISWKTAEVRLIPKPGKSPHIDNLRPISLTSCVGKIMERIMLLRLQEYLDDTQQMPNSMFGFRKHLCTQDILVQMKEDILVPATGHSPRAILTLDLKGAFDNVAHKGILHNLASTGCGERTYNYIADFLSHRQEIIKIGDVSSHPITLGDRGTPQGSVCFST